MNKFSPFLKEEINTFHIRKVFYNVFISTSPSPTTLKSGKNIGLRQEL